MVSTFPNNTSAKRNKILISCLAGVGLVVGGYLVLGSLLGGKTSLACADSNARPLRADSVTQFDESDDGNIIELRLVPPDKPVLKGSGRASCNSPDSKPNKTPGILEPKRTAASLEKVPVVDTAVICLAINQQEADNVIQAIPSTTRKTYCWARILNGRGQKIRYIWYLNQTAYPSQWLYITSDRFRSWCPKYIPPQTKGPIKVEIVDQTGRLLKSIELPVKPVKSPMVKQG